LHTIIIYFVNEIQRNKQSCYAEDNLGGFLPYTIFV